MFKNLMIKWKLALLVAVMLGALAVVGISGHAGIAAMGGAVADIGGTRLSSLQGLLMISDGQSAVAAATLSNTLYENNYQSQEKFAETLRARQKAWADIDAGWKIYAPLMQTSHEAVLWKWFISEWAAWKSADLKLAATIAELARNGDEQRQKDLFVEFYRQYQEARPLFASARATLSRIREVNDALAKNSVHGAVASVGDYQKIVRRSALAAALLIIVCAVLIARAITRPIMAALTVAHTMAGGDLRGPVVVGTKEEGGQLLQELKDMGEAMGKIVAQARGSSDTIASASIQILSGNIELSSRTVRQAGTLEQTTLSMKELASTVGHNAGHALQAHQLAVSAFGAVLKGDVAMSRMVETMTSINAAATKSAGIIGAIDDMAFQSSTLALNAAVEAAQAGEHGRGFGSVAEEMHALAQRSAQVARDIKMLIGDTVRKAGAGNALAAEAGRTMDEIVAGVQRVNNITSEMRLATQGQRAGVERIAVAISQADRAILQNTVQVEKASAAAASLREQAGSLDTAVKAFKVDAGAWANVRHDNVASFVPAAPLAQGARARPVLRIVPSPR